VVRSHDAYCLFIEAAGTTSLPITESGLGAQEGKCVIDRDRIDEEPEVVVFWVTRIV
jgi:hypothetical protein